MPSVLFLTHSLDRGGQSVHIANLGTGLMQRGWECTVGVANAAPGSPLGKGHFESRGIPVVEVPFYPPDLSGGYSAQAGGILKLRQLVESTKPDVVHLHSVSLAPLARIASRMARHKPALVSTCYNEYISERRRKTARLLGAVGVPPHPFGDRVIAISDAIYEDLTDGLRIPKSVVRKIDHAVDDTRFRPPTDAERHEARKQLGVPNDAVVIGCVASIEPIENHRELIHALPSLEASGHDVRLVVAGPDINDHAKVLRGLANQLGVEARVHFTGFVDPRTVYWAADINARVSTSEGAGLVIVEGMLCGVAALRSTSAGATNQIIDGRTGYLVEEATGEAIAQAVRRVLDDPERAADIRRAALDFAASRYRLARMATQVETVYDEARLVSRGSGLKALLPPDRPLGQAARSVRNRARMLLRRQQWHTELLAALSAAIPQARFVQVGSNDADYGDPLSHYIAEGGWQGLMIEPLPDIFARLCLRYAGKPGLQFANVAIDNTSGPRAFYHLRPSDDPELPPWYEQLGSFLKDNLLKHQWAIPDIADRIVEATVPCMTFDAVCADHGIERVDVLHIDAEGYDCEILRTIDLGRFQPALVLFEHKHLTPEDKAAALAYCHDAGYVTHADPSDCVAVAQTALAAHPEIARQWLRLSAGRRLPLARRAPARREAQATHGRSLPGLTSST